MNLEYDDSVFDIFKSYEEEQNNEIKNDKKTIKIKIPKKKMKLIKERRQNKNIKCENSDCEKDLLVDDGLLICSTCGRVYERHITDSAEWRYYGVDDSKLSNPTRCGLPVNDLLPKSSLGSFIGHGGKESYDIRLIRKYQMWNSMPYKERSLYNVFETLTVNATNNGIPSSIVEDAKRLYKDLSQLKIYRGDNRKGLIASSIYMSCKKNNVPRSQKEIAKIFNLKPTTMTKGCKRFQDLMKMNIESTTPSDFIIRYCSRLGINKEFTDICITAVKRTEDLGIISQNTPPSIAAGVINLVSTLCSLNISKKDIHNCCDISEVTIGKCYKILYQYRKYLFSINDIKKYKIKI